MKRMIRYISRPVLAHIDACCIHVAEASFKNRVAQEQYHQHADFRQGRLVTFAKVVAVFSPCQYI